MDFSSGKGVVRGRRGQQLEFALDNVPAQPLCLGVAAQLDHHVVNIACGDERVGVIGAEHTLLHQHVLAVQRLCLRRTDPGGQRTSQQAPHNKRAP